MTYCILTLTYTFIDWDCLRRGNPLKNQTIREKLLQTKLQGFAHRQQEMTALSNTLHDRSTEIRLTNIFGFGGVGKSLLLLKFLDDLRKNSPSVRTAYARGQESSSPISIMDEIRREFVLNESSDSFSKSNFPNVGLSDQTLKLLEEMDQSQLRRTLGSYFDRSEIENLCFDLGIDIDELPSNSKTELVREFLLFTNRHGLSSKLATHLASNYPDILLHIPGTGGQLLPNAQITTPWRQYDTLRAKFSAIQNQVEAAIVGNRARYEAFKASHTTNPFMLDSIGESSAYGYLRSVLPQYNLNTYMKAEAELAVAFGEALGEISDKHDGIVLIFDNFETLDHIETWFQDGLLKCLPANCFVVISSRKQLSLEQWRDWNSILNFIQINPFSRDETIAFLKENNVNDASIQGEIHLATKGIPVLLTIIVENLKRGTDISVISSQYLSLDELLFSSLFSHINDKNYVKLIQECAFFRRLDLDLFDAVCQRLNLDTQFSDIKQYLFLERFTDGTFAIQRSVREIVTSYLVKSAPKRYVESHRAAASIFASRIAELSHYDKSWLGNVVEHVHHSCSFSLQEGFRVFQQYSLVFDSFDHLHPLLVLKSLLAEMRNHSWKELTHKHWLAFLDAKVAESFGKWKEADKIYIQLLNNPNLDRQLKEELYAKIGDLYCNHSLKYTTQVYQAYFDAAQRSKNTKKIAVALKKQGDVLVYQGNWRLACEKYESSLQLARASGDPIDIAWLYLSLGYAYRVNGEWTRAFRYIKLAHGLFVEHKNEYGMGISLRIQGQLQYGVHEYELAYKSYFASCKITAKSGDKFNTARTAINIGKSLAALNRFGEAESYVKAGLSIFDQLDAPFPVAAAQIIRASIFRRLGNRSIAIEHAKRGLQMLRDIESPAYILKALVELMQIYNEDKEYSKVLELSDEAFQMGYEASLIDNLSKSHFIVAQIHLNQNNVSLAIEHFDKALLLALRFNIFAFDNCIAELKRVLGHENETLSDLLRSELKLRWKDEERVLLESEMAKRERVLMQKLSRQNVLEKL